MKESDKPDLAQTVVLRAESPQPRALSETQAAQTQVLAFDVEQIRARSIIVQNEQEGSDGGGKTMILWASEVQPKPPRTAALAKPLAKPLARATSARTLKHSLLNTLVYKRSPLRPQQLRAAIAILAVALSCGIAWQYTQEPAPAEHIVKPRPATPAPTSNPSAAAPTPAAAVVAPSPSASASGASNASERAAVDALHAGDYARAAQAYEALSRAHPERREFREALHILQRAEADTGAGHPW